MPTHPFFNALGAFLYIGGLVCFLHYVESIRHDTPDTIFDGIGAISLFTLSAAVMAYLFFYQPVALLIARKQAEASAYLLRTIGFFFPMAITALCFTTLQ
jgi:hypothetical protein